MEFLFLTLFLLIGYGATTIITKGQIFDPFRSWLDTGYNSLSKNFFGLLIVCPLCVGFWWGVIQSLTLYSPVMSIFYSSFEFTGILSYILYFFMRTYALILDGCLLGGFAWSVHVGIDLLQKKFDFFDTKELYYQWLAAKGEEEKQII